MSKPNSTTCDACSTDVGPFFPRIVFDRPAGQSWGGTPTTVGMTCLACKLAHMPRAAIFPLVVTPVIEPEGDSFFSCYRWGVYVGTFPTYLAAECAAARQDVGNTEAIDWDNDPFAGYWDGTPTPAFRSTMKGRVLA